MPPLSFVGNWTLVRDGVYFYPAEDFMTLSYFDFATKRVHPVFKVAGGVLFWHRLCRPTVATSCMLMFDQRRSDIMLVDGFR